MNFTRSLYQSPSTRMTPSCSKAHEDKRTAHEDKQTAFPTSALPTQLNMPTFRWLANKKVTSIRLDNDCCKPQSLLSFYKSFARTSASFASIFVRILSTTD